MASNTGNNVWFSAGQGKAKVMASSAKLPQQQQQQPHQPGDWPSLRPDIAQKSSAPRVLKPPKIDQEEGGEWHKVGVRGKPMEKVKKISDDEEEEDIVQKVPKTEEELEEIRKQRRERRKKMKENKKKLKEEEKRRRIYENKTSKIQFISSDVMNRVTVAKRLQDSMTVLKSRDDEVKSDKKSEKVKFLDEEYPELGAKEGADKNGTNKELISRLVTDFETGLAISDAESGSEWETEHEDSELNPKDMLDTLNDDIAGIPTFEIEKGDSSQHKSYSSILSRRTTTISQNPKSLGLARTTKIIPRPAAIKDETEEVKKVRKKDPVTIDLLAAIQSKKPSKKADKKTISVLSNPISHSKKKSLGGNKLDSSAPAIRRGKEREKPKKKKKTKMKSIILADRARRREERLKNQQQHKVQEDLSELGQVLNSVSASEGTCPPEPTKEEEVIKEVQESNEKESETNEEKKGETFNDLEPQEKAKLLIHSRKFRNYCNHDLSEELNGHCRLLLSDIVRFQDNMFAKDPVKAKARKRYVVGLREVKKFITVKKVQCLVVAPDLEPVMAKGGLNDMIGTILDLARENNTPIFFCMNRRKLGYAMLRKVPVACVGIMNYQGSDENFKKMSELLPSLEASYEQKLQDALKSVNANPNEQESSQSNPIPSQMSEEVPTFPNSSAVPFQWSNYNQQSFPQYHYGPWPGSFNNNYPAQYYGQQEQQQNSSHGANNLFRTRIEDPSEEIKREFLRKLKESFK